MPQISKNAYLILDESLRRLQGANKSLAPTIEGALRERDDAIFYLIADLQDILGCEITTLICNLKGNPRDNLLALVNLIRGKIGRMLMDWIPSNGEETEIKVEITHTIDGIQISVLTTGDLDKARRIANLLTEKMGDEVAVISMKRGFQLRSE